MDHVSRRGFLAGVPGLAAAGGVLGLTTGARSVGAPRRDGAGDDPAVYGGFPRQDAAAVQEIVGVSHGNIDRVRALVTARPALAKAVWDWGFGDWESALGAASHVGRRDIAELLLEHGARPDIFAYAMLGAAAAVKAMVEAQPGAQRIPGPHGIPLLRHAKAGGEEAAAVVAYLEGLGDAGIEQQSLPLTPEQTAAYFGTFEVESGTAAAPGTRFELKDRKGSVVFQPADGSFRGLFRVGEHEFHPTGAPAVRFKIEMEGGRATRLTITDGTPIVTAQRVG